MCCAINYCFASWAINLLKSCIIVLSAHFDAYFILTYHVYNYVLLTIIVFYICIRCTPRLRKHGIILFTAFDYYCSNHCYCLLLLMIFSYTVSLIDYCISIIAYDYFRCLTELFSGVLYIKCFGLIILFSFINIVD